MHIQNYCRDIAGFIQRFGKDYQLFIQDRAYFNAVSMCILQIGELANGLSVEFREETKEQMQWGLIRGMRNWLAHAYTEMDENVIWETATNSIPGLLHFCERVIAQERGKDLPPVEKPSILQQLTEGKKAVETPGSESQNKKSIDPER